MPSEEDKDYIEKTIRLKEICAKELNIHQDEVSLENFIKWLIDKVLPNEK